MTNTPTDPVSTVLARLYSLWYAEDGPLGLDVEAFEKEGAPSRDAIWGALTDLGRARYADIYSGGANISPLGIIAAEESGVADASLSAAHNRLRFLLLDQLARYQEEHGRNWHVDWELLIADAGVSDKAFHQNFQVLELLGLMEPMGRVLAISVAGRAKVDDYRQRKALVDEFNELANSEAISPQARGRRFERLMEGVLANNGWQVERSVLAPGEENDLIIHQGSDYYLLELKWLAGSVPPKELDRLIRKAEKRPGVSGLFLSMSGYTPGAIDDAREALTQGRLILLFGAESIRSVIGGKSSFAAILQQKRHAAATRRQLDLE